MDFYRSLKVFAQQKIIFRCENVFQLITNTAAAQRKSYSQRLPRVTKTTPYERIIIRAGYSYIKVYKKKKIPNLTDCQNFVVSELWQSIILSTFCQMNFRKSNQELRF